MKFFLVGMVLIGINLFAYSDKDLDGVEDSIDHCPDTLISELVNSRGCPIHSLQSEYHYDIVAGFGFSQMNYLSNENADTFTSTLQADYFYKNFSAQMIASHYTSNSQTDTERGLNDTLLAFFYQLPVGDHVQLKTGGGVLLPTYKTGYDNEATDYFGSISLSYSINPKVTLIGGYSYTIIRDEDVGMLLNYQDIQAYYGGANYTLKQNFFIGSLYNKSDSLYKNVESIEKISLYSTYQLDAHWFGNINYSYGVSHSASDHSLDLQIGYYF